MEKEIFVVDRLSLKGDGVGHRKGETQGRGKVAFIPYVLPGEEVSARPLFDKKSFSRQIPLQLMKSSTERRPPPCPLHFEFGKKTWCGGCDWQHIKREAQLAAKTELVRETLERLGGLKNPPMNAILYDSHEFRYRNKVQVPIGGTVKNIQTGFFHPDSHTLVPFTDCLIQPESSIRILDVLRNIISILKWQPYDEDRHRGYLRHILVRTNKIGQAFVALITKDPGQADKELFVKLLREQCPLVVGLFQNIQPKQTHVIVGERWVKWWGEDRLEEVICGMPMGYSPGSFFQVNTGAAELLFQQAIEDLALSGNEVVLDIYCGVGALTLLLARKTRFAVGVEVASSSIRDAKENAAQNKISNVRFHQEDAVRFFHSDEIENLERRGGRLFVTVDPPRSGLDPVVVRALMNLMPLRIVYISCDPATLARDLKLFSSRYEISSITPVDLFPQTSHIETVTRLDLKRS